MLDFAPASTSASALVAATTAADMKKYDWIVTYLFRMLSAGYSIANLPEEMPFTSKDIKVAMEKAKSDGYIDKSVANISDIKYTYDARKNFPAEVEQAGPITWLQSNGKGNYVLRRTRRPNIIHLPTGLSESPEIECIEDSTPAFILKLLGQDEQAMFTRVRNANLIGKVLGLETAQPLQSHHRTTLNYGQIEVDEIQAAETRDGELVIAPISGKVGRDKLSWSQARNLNTYASEKAPTAEHVKSIGLWRDAEDTIWTAQFSSQTEIDEIEIEKVRRFRLQ
ncbi:hypothetical protein [Limimaricola soesokkakensis]|uniref:hypothetical protein n=1 Tax=Limimaricola soesokkakensis TaxID=1343159 RepID=UPI0035133CF1